MKLAKLEPIPALEGLTNMLAELNKLRAGIDNEAGEIAELWEGLGRANGQREDHAAAFLGRLRPHLQGIAEFASRCDAQIADMIADPFGRND